MEVVLFFIGLWILGSIFEFISNKFTEWNNYNKQSSEALVLKNLLQGPYSEESLQGYRNKIGLISKEKISNDRSGEYLAKRSRFIDQEISKKCPLCGKTNIYLKKSGKTFGCRTYHCHYQGNFKKLNIEIQAIETKLFFNQLNIAYELLRRKEK
jgi:predicted RNA-binding Zn-ribbon protein involved in translation (DUF1610 family)